MSEYQYYEFQAIDRPLTGQQMEQLRQYSSRAQITPTSFVNEYNWGDFKGDEDEWMERYFDALLYFANWGTRTFRLRLPAAVLDPAVGRAYLGGRPTSVRQTKGNVILTFGSELDGGDDFGELEGPGLLSSLLPVRAELARGDRRALYLGWLAAVLSDEFKDDTVEPPVPPGLGQLSGRSQHWRPSSASIPICFTSPRKRVRRGLSWPLPCLDGGSGQISPMGTQPSRKASAGTSSGSTPNRIVRAQCIRRETIA